MPRTPLIEEILAAGTTHARGPFRVATIADPGPALRGLGDGLIDVIAAESSRMLGGIDVGAYWRDRSDYLESLSEWTVAERDGALAAWCGVKDIPDAHEPLVYFDTLGVMREHRRTGLGAVLAFEAWQRARRRSPGRPLLTMRTQSAVVFSLMRRLAPWRTYPQVAAGQPRPAPDSAMRAASRTAAVLSPDRPFEPNTWIVRRAVDHAGSLYGGPPPRSGDSDLDDFFARHVDVDAGDSVVGVVLTTRPVLARARVLHAHQRIRVARTGGRPAGSVIAVPEESLR